jgi:hypothetical protein
MKRKNEKSRFVRILFFYHQGAIDAKIGKENSSDKLTDPMDIIVYGLGYTDVVSNDYSKEIKVEEIIEKIKNKK